MKKHILSLSIVLFGCFLANANDYKVEQYFLKYKEETRPIPEYSFNQIDYIKNFKNFEEKANAKERKIITDKNKMIVDLTDTIDAALTPSEPNSKKLSEKQPNSKKLSEKQRTSLSLFVLFVDLITMKYAPNECSIEELMYMAKLADAVQFHSFYKKIASAIAEMIEPTYIVEPYDEKPFGAFKWF